MCPPAGYNVIRVKNRADTRVRPYEINNVVAELASAKTFMIAVINCRESKLSDKPIFILDLHCRRHDQRHVADLRTVAMVGIPRYLINPTYILDLRTVATVGIPLYLF